MDSQGALGQFLEESYTHVENFEQGLLTLEKNYNQQEYIRSLYRCMHTIKGSAGFFNFKVLENLVHKTEDIFSHLLKLEDEKRIDLIKKNQLTNLFFKVNDEIKRLLNNIKEKNFDQLKSAENLIQDLTNYNLEIFSNQELSITLKNPSKKLNPLQMQALEDLKQSLKNEIMNVKNYSEDLNLLDLKLDDNIIIKLNTLEALSSLSAELVVARNQMELLLNEECDYSSKLFTNIHKIDQLVNALSDRITKIRLQPISKVTDKLKRIVRDTAISCGKEVNLEIYGESIEIDRGILEIIKDPLIHLLRNAIDHGIESPEERIKKDKELSGLITIRAAYGENCVKLSITDDGKGIDLKKIINKALENNLITREQLKTIVRKDLLNLIFHPGFSTKSEVTNLSGRGIGMNVVKETISKVNGSIEINTAENYGTEFLIKLPVTLALRTSVIVDIAGQTYAIPSNFIKDINKISLRELVNKDFIEIREEYFKVIFIERFLNNSQANNYCNVNHEVEYLLIDTGDSKFILIVDSVLDLQNIIIKPIPENVHNPGFFAGTTILPDGKVALVFDLDEVFDAQELYESMNKVCTMTNFNLLRPNKSPVKRILSFYLGEFYFGINYEHVKEAVSIKDYTTLPGTEIETLINLRGRVLSSKNLRFLVNKNYSANQIFDLNIIIEANNHQFAIQIDELDEIIEIKDEMLLDENMPAELKPLCRNAYKLKDKILYLLKDDVCMKAA